MRAFFPGGIIALVVIVTVCGATARAQSDSALVHRHVNVGAAASMQRGRTPSRARGVPSPRASVFIENRGQWDSTVRYMMRGGGITTWITDDGMVYDYHAMVDTSTGSRRGFSRFGRGAGGTRRGHVIRVRFENSSRATSSHGVGRSRGYYNFLRGRDTTRWARRVSGFDEVVTQAMYRGVDVVHYVDHGYPRYDVVVRPGGDPSAIRMRVDGSEGVRIDSLGQLRMQSSLGDLYQGRPVAYQEIDGRRVSVLCAFNRTDSTHVRFNVGGYDTTRALIIDPIVFSTYLGGSGDDWARAVTVDSAEAVFVVGYTGSLDFPTTVGVYSDSTLGSWDVFLTKLTADGTEALFSTYFGGSGSDEATGVAIDSNEVVICGNTESSDLPTPYGWDTTLGGGSDGFVARISTDGIAVNAATYIGGSDADGCTGIAINSVGRIAIAGSTTSSDLPVVNALQSTTGGGEDAMLALFDYRLDTVQFVSYLGGSGLDNATGIGIDSSDRIHVTGLTDSASFPTTANAAQATDGSPGYTTAFYSRLSSDGTQLLYSTFLGGSGSEESYGIAVTPGGEALVTGRTASSDFPTTPVGVYQSSYGGTTDAFVTRYDTAGTVVYSTFLGGPQYEAASGIAVDERGFAYTCGTASDSFPTVSGSFDTTANGYDDGFVAVLDSVGSTLTYSTYLGGATSNDWQTAIVAFGVNKAITVGRSQSTDFPTSIGAFQGSLTANVDATVTRLYTVASAGDTSTRGVVNSSRPVVGIESCGECIYVDKPAPGEPLGFASGDRLLIMQMSGALFDEENRRTFGTIDAYGSAGLYEFATVTATNDVVIGGDSLVCVEIGSGLTFAYSPRTDPVQIIHVPQYHDVTIAGAPLTVAPWDGTSGGVLVLEASGTITLEDDIDVSGKGFRGGDPSDEDVLYSDESFYDYVLDYSEHYYSGMKGEGIGDAHRSITGDHWRGRGPLVSGGGGGNARGGGGGGGSNRTAGGDGGRQAQLGPADTLCPRSSVGGVGGVLLAYHYQTPYRVFMGGGGGGGDRPTDNAPGHSQFGGWGANGGGIIILRAAEIHGVTTNGIKPTISANGSSGGFATFGGGGGGGAGGAIVLGIPSMTGQIEIAANGGNGANVWGLTDYCYGPGGGGGAGYIRIGDDDVSETDFPMHDAGGDAGQQWSNGSTHTCAGLTVNYGATDAADAPARHAGAFTLPGTAMPPLSAILTDPQWWGSTVDVRSDVWLAAEERLEVSGGTRCRPGVHLHVIAMHW